MALFLQTAVFSPTPWGSEASVLPYSPERRNRLRQTLLKLTLRDSRELSRCQISGVVENRCRFRRDGDSDSHIGIPRVSDETGPTLRDSVGASAAAASEGMATRTRTRTRTPTLVGNSHFGIPRVSDETGAINRTNPFPSALLQLPLPKGWRLRLRLGLGLRL